MKDYRLSEIRAICKHRTETEEYPCYNCEIVDVCSVMPRYLPVEPRDMIELPCVEHRITDYGKDRWDVYYRNGIGGVIDYSRFNTEAEADAFLAELKGDKE